MFGTHFYFMVKIFLGLKYSQVYGKITSGLLRFIQHIMTPKLAASYTFFLFLSQHLFEFMGPYRTCRGRYMKERTKYGPVRGGLKMHFFRSRALLSDYYLLWSVSGQKDPDASTYFLPALPAFSIGNDSIKCLVLFLVLS